MTTRPRKRTMTFLAVGLLLLDGALLLLAGFWAKNILLGVLGAGFLVLAGSVLLYYRRYRRTLAEVDQAREALRAEALELRRLIQERKEP